MAEEKKVQAGGADDLVKVLKLPVGFLLVRYVRGTSGMHPIGRVVRDHIYTMSVDDALIYCTGQHPSFEPVLPADKAMIGLEVERKEKAAADAARANLEKQLAGR